MTIALIAHDSKKELMVQFCTAYCRILSQHKLVATGTTGKLISEATGLQVQRFLAGVQGGDQQIASRIACNEIDLLLFFRDPINAKPSEPNDAAAPVRCAQHPHGHQHRHRRGADPRPRARRSGLARYRAPPELKYVKKKRCIVQMRRFFLRRKRLAQTVPFTLKSCAISCTSAAVNSPKGSSSRARVSCGSAASAALSSSAASTAGQTVCTPSLPSSTRA